MKYETINPADGKRVETYSTATDAEVDRALDRAGAAFAGWRVTPIEKRAEALRRIAGVLEAQAARLASLMALEMGKPLAEGEAEARKCALACRYYADHAAAFLEPRSCESDGTRAYVRYDPLGPILAIMPWNFPFWQFFRAAAPALTAGNPLLLKHAPNTPGCALGIEKLVDEAGVPGGLVQNLFLTNHQAARVIADLRVRGVTLTGSAAAGREVASVAGRWLKPMVMELGGSDPFIVFEDADVERAVTVGAAARCINNGQSCIAAKRFLVQRSVFNRFRDGLVEAMGRRKMGDPRDAGTTLGPLARRDLRDHLADQVGRTLSLGAEALLGGRVPDREGFFYPPTVLAGVKPGTPAADEELFGPAATLIPFEKEEEALAIANGGAYGLGASLWTGDPARAERLIPAIESGAVFVNGMVKSDPRLPFGGVKDSGFGRELGPEGIHEFVNIKTVWIA